MPSVMHAVTNFVNAIVGIFVQLFNSIFAVFHAIFALGLDVVNSVVTVVQHLVAMVLDLFQGVLGFVAGEFLFCWLENTVDSCVLTCVFQRTLSRLA